MFYRSETPPINLNDIFHAANETEADRNAYHNAVKHRPDAWGFRIMGCTKDGFSALVTLQMTWKVDSTTRPRYTKLNHIRRIIEIFAKRLLERDMLSAYDPMELSVSVENDTLIVEQDIEVLRRVDPAKVVPVEESEDHQ